MEDLKEKISEQAKSLMPQLSAWRRELHRHPGLGFDVRENRDFIVSELKKMGLHPESCGKAGLTALLGKGGGRTVLLRSDMDALPLDEQSGEEFSSLNPGKMHACGHDMHMAMLLGAAKILKDNEDQLEGYVKLMFQPAEEIGLGSKDMADAGVLENPKVDCAEMIHVAAGVPFETGSMLIPQSGRAASSCCDFKIKIIGKGGHGANPEYCVDPISCICHVLCGLEEMSAREIGFNEPLTVTIGRISGGSVNNVIPDTAEMIGTVRTMDRKIAEWAQKRISEIANGIATAYRCKAEVIYECFLPPLSVEAHTSDCAEKYLTEIFGDSAFRVPGGGSSSGSEDFATITELVPSVPLFLAAGNSMEGYKVPVHNAAVRFDERALPVGTAAHAYFAMRYLQEHK